MNIELEYKYRVPDAETLSRILAAAPQYARQTEELRRLAMRTTYYDTDSGAFSARLWTLRLRRENDAALVALKTSLRDGLRGEWEAAAESVEQALPALLRQGAPPELERLFSERLRPVCGAAFERRALLLELSDGSLCELAADLGELTGKTQSLPLCELELELKRGLPEQMRRLGERFCTEFGLQPEKLSKFARAKQLK